MSLLNNFSGWFGDFPTMFHDTDLSEYNIFTWKDPSNESVSILRIIGYTSLKPGYLLHAVPVPSNRLSESTENLIEEFGVCFISLSQLLGEWGFAIQPISEKEEE